MLLACLWSGLCLGFLGCGPLEARALDSRRTPFCAPSTASLPAQQKTKERLLLAMQQPQLLPLPLLSRSLSVGCCTSTTLRSRRPRGCATDPRQTL